eukprot:gnl/TRDRNA2_/TRDRNA2_40567_c0_seq1.p1 gnl/TRDRNA2_/TRDRNA2_40567_c0~~gnl/TRDRNA2_/TRDRNA2_40567_c0_seq1.p1  ORF type:complete len:125 (+),score=13.54 gnl/TRDRNA2_/TRDRNA2_40567_c0_seq1:99-473(+)
MAPSLLSVLVSVLLLPLASFGLSCKTNGDCSSAKTFGRCIDGECQPVFRDERILETVVPHEQIERGFRWFTFCQNIFTWGWRAFCLLVLYGTFTLCHHAWTTDEEPLPEGAMPARRKNKYEYKK